MAAKSRLTGRDLLLLLLYVPGATGEINEPIRGRTRFMKFVFIFEQELFRPFGFDRSIEETTMPLFSAWRFGPFSKDVFDALDFFTRIGLVEVASMPVGEVLPEEASEYGRWREEIELDDGDEIDEYMEERFRLTDMGIRFVEANNMYEGLSANQRHMLQEYKRRFNSSPLSAILRYVYHTYPDTISNSEIRDKVLGTGDLHY